MLKDREIEQGWHDTFSTSNPFCPCDLKTFTKAVRWAELAVARHILKAREANTAPTAAVDDRKIADTVNQLRDIAIQYRDTQQLRERIAHVVVPLLRASMPERKAVTDKRILEIWEKSKVSGLQREEFTNFYRETRVGDPIAFARALLATTASDSATPQETGEAKS